jgi:hypothetical protein
MTSAIKFGEREHQCLPRHAQPCPACGELLSPPVFCGICGEDVTPLHQCAPHPLPHAHAQMPIRGACLTCGQPMPAALFCTTCGADITPSHHCPAAPPTHVHRADQLHICPSFGVNRCKECDRLMPAMTFCAQCGMDVTEVHHCPPMHAVHICAPLVTMPRRCAKCGEPMPASRHCTQCGADTTPEHQCSRA